MKKNLSKYYTNIIRSIIGDYDFLNNREFKIPFIKKGKITKKRYLQFQEVLFTFSIIFLGGHLLFFNGKYLISGITNFFLFLLILRGINYFIHSKYKKIQFEIETIGYFVMNELLIVLGSSKSLKNAVKYVSMGNYPYYSEIFSKALLETHFGELLPERLKINIDALFPKQISETLSLIVNTWEYGENITILTKNRIISKLSEKIVEKTERIDTWTSLSSGLVFLSPPILICFLLISGNMNKSIGILIPFFMVLASVFFLQDEEWGFFSKNNISTLSYDPQEIKFLVLLAENLSQGYSFPRSLSLSIQLYQKNFKHYANEFTQIQLNANEKAKNNLINNLFNTRTVYLLNIIEKHSLIDPVRAGEKILKITQDLSKINELLNLGRAKLRATHFQESVIQVLSIISLAFIAGASPIFMFVERALNYSFHEPLLLNHVQSFEIEFILIGVTLSILPLRNINFSGLKKVKISQFEFSFKLLKFGLFLVIYCLVNQLFFSSF